MTNEFFTLKNQSNKNMVLITQYNEKYFRDINEFINVYGFFLQEYLEFNGGLMEMIEHSIKNSMLSNYLVECNFTIDNETIKFNTKSIIDHFEIEDTTPENESYINKGEMVIDDSYVLNFCNSYCFIRNMDTNKMYLYYLD